MKPFLAFMLALSMAPPSSLHAVAASGPEPFYNVVSADSSKAVLATIAAKRRGRAAATTGDSASEFLKSPNRNMTGSSLVNDGRCTPFHFNGMGPEGRNESANLALLMRGSTANGATRTTARPISTGACYQKRNQAIARTKMIGAGAVIQFYRDGEKTWNDPGGDIRGIHPGVVPLKDGRHRRLVEVPRRGRSSPDLDSPGFATCSGADHRGNLARKRAGPGVRHHRKFPGAESTCHRQAHG